MRARYYDPINGRFASQDPKRSGLNWFAYCNDNPIAYADTSGQAYSLAEFSAELAGLYAEALVLNDMGDTQAAVDFFSHYAEELVIDYMNGNSTAGNALMTSAMNDFNMARQFPNLANFLLQQGEDAFDLAEEQYGQAGLIGSIGRWEANLYEGFLLYGDAGTDLVD